MIVGILFVAAGMFFARLTWDFVLAAGCVGTIHERILTSGLAAVSGVASVAFVLGGLVKFSGG